VIEVARAILLPLWPAVRPAGFWGRLGVILALFALAGAGALAILGRVPGRAGLWLEIALAIGSAYLVGCTLGSVLRALWTRVTRAAAPD
jgi:hypothetical protein